MKKEHSTFTPFKLSRRDFLQTTLTGATALALGTTLFAQPKPKHVLLPLPYDYDALEPYIDEQTMRIHHDKHHQGYVDKLNNTIEELDEKFHDMSVETLLRNINWVPQDKKQAVINYGGGHANHSLFWKVMSPEGGGTPPEILLEALDKAFGSFESFKSRFEKAAMNRFGSGWAWLVIDNYGNLTVYSTANQDSPLMKKHKPLLGLDVWEHAYYLKYQNRRGDYVKNFFNIVNWSYVAELYTNSTETG